MATKDILAKALSDSGAPPFMVELASVGAYDDFESNSATPQLDLMRDCHQLGLTEFRQRVMDGEFDATREESEAFLRDMACQRETNGIVGYYKAE